MNAFDAPPKPNLALIIDAYGWAFDNIAKQIKKHLSSSFCIDIITLNELSELHYDSFAEHGTVKSLVRPNALGRLLLIAPKYDIVHFFYKEMFAAIAYGAEVPALVRYARTLGLSVDYLIDSARSSTVFTTAIYDHEASDVDSLNIRSKSFSRLIDSYIVSSNKLYSIYSQHATLIPPSKIISDGVDFAKFFPIHLSRLGQVRDRDLIVGWAGNSKWGDGTTDHKGYHTILKPAILGLQQQGFRVHLEVQDRNDTYIPLEEMVHYYAKLDVYVCVSDAEGTPNPVLEAMACGVPIISTDVGIVGELMGTLQSQFILTERSIKSLQRALIIILQTPGLLSSLSSENLSSITSWSWHRQADKFRTFFLDALHERAKRAAEQ